MPFAEPHCPTRPALEPILNAIIAGLLTERRVPPGSIVDAGAADGRFACYYAAIAPERLVHAVDPSFTNIKWIQKHYSPSWPNLKALHGGLGNDPLASRAVRKTLQTADQNFSIFRLDDLFNQGPWSGETLALGHFDVEGWEEHVLRGGLQVIKRDLPLLVTESQIQRRLGAAQRLLHLFRELEYDSYLIEEITGLQADLRNILHIPKARRASFVGSNVLDVAVASRTLLAVTHKNVEGFAYPCCQPGGVCCPNRQHCCSHNLVSRWLTRVVQNGGADLQWYSRTTWYDQHKHLFRPEIMLAVQEVERQRNLSEAGFSYVPPLKKLVSPTSLGRDRTALSRDPPKS